MVPSPFCTTSWIQIQLAPVDPVDPVGTRPDVTGSTPGTLSGSVEDAAAWVLGALAHLVELNDAPRARVALEAQGALPAMCRLLRWGEGLGIAGIMGGMDDKCLLGCTTTIY